MKKILVASLLASAMLAGSAQARVVGWEQSGIASHYSEGQRTASGERFNPQDYTAAHRSLPFGTRVKVEHVRTGRTVVVRINDRGPFIRGRVIDLSNAAARQLGFSGLAPVRLRVIEVPR